MGRRAKLKVLRTQAREVLDVELRGLTLEFSDGSKHTYEPSMTNHRTREVLRKRYLAGGSQ